MDAPLTAPAMNRAPRPAKFEVCEYDCASLFRETGAGARGFGNKSHGRKARGSSGAETRPCRGGAAREGENAERAEAIAELREIEVGRLALLESALKPVVRQAPPGVDMFDLTLTQGERPRLFST